MTDLIISGNSCYIECFASRYDLQNYNIIIETWLKKSELQDLKDSIRPGAVNELYNIMGRPRFYDTSWRGYNTIQIKAVPGEQTYYMRGNKVVFVKNISSSPLEGPSEWLNCKLECTISGQGAL